MSLRFDAIVVGTGQAGPSLAARLAGSGRKVAIVERKLFGGTCVNVGCIPTKALVASARAAWVTRQAQRWGVVVDGAVHADMKAVKARKDAVVAASNTGLTSWLKGLENTRIFEGHARFEAPHTLRVADTLLEADWIFLNVGGRAAVPPLPGIEGVPYLTNSGMVEVDFLPEHLVIVGGSYIGLEFAQMYRRFGSRVTVIEQGPRLIAREDEDVSEAIRQILEQEGVAVRLKASCISLARQGQEVAVGVDCTSGSPAVVGRTCSWPWAGGPTPTTSASTRPASPRMSEGTSSWTTS